jgi:isoamyl acetate esterase
MAAYVQDSIMLLGDSLTQNSWEPYGLGQRLSSQEIPVFITAESSTKHARRADLYVRKMDVINRGFSGYNTVWAIPVFEQVCLLAKSRVVLFSPDESNLNSTEGLRKAA